ncbi:CPCC family cysteine-rich protein [Bacillus alkalicellulosilyticus]|uniref:CPCC family cysteine-rich protein n=1 Tax=Alkalihalobacterium alkalicellulosilyticum TaxID=1912214 RepID=UPI000995E6FF|nr:CPCC family cysteine-rich protein [Bacillus alkalicellulosilyticus]
MKFTCPCCGYKTLDEKPPGTDEICKICFWHDDFVQYEDPDFKGGANDVSLRQAQQNYTLFGACQEDCIQFVRKPTKNDSRDSSWKPLTHN